MNRIHIKYCCALLFIFLHSIELIHVLGTTQHFDKVFVMCYYYQLKVLLARSAFYQT